jgi:8-oxo-dGTP pyrophosphatase MutT (NUDIX family)
MDKIVQNGTIVGTGSEANFGSEGGRHAVVGVLYENKQFLVIRRSLKVRAPGLICFPGGGIEPGESLVEAVKRELFEEINLSVGVVGHLWTSQTRWGAKLEWMLCQRLEGHEPEANPEEVSEVMWKTAESLLGRDDLLGSMPDFLAEYDRGRFAGFLVS